MKENDGGRDWKTGRIVWNEPTIVLGFVFVEHALFSSFVFTEKFIFKSFTFLRLVLQVLFLKVTMNPRIWQTGGRHLFRLASPYHTRNTYLKQTYRILVTWQVQKMNQEVPFSYRCYLWFSTFEFIYCTYVHILHKSLMIIFIIFIDVRSEDSLVINNSRSERL